MASPPRQQRLHLPLTRGKPNTVRGERAAPLARGRREVRTADRSSQRPGGGRGGCLDCLKSLEEVAARRAGWGLGSPRRSAAPRSPDVFHLASAAAEAARPPALSTAPSRGGRRRARPAAVPDRHPPRAPTPSRARPGPRGSPVPPPLPRPAGRASKTGGDCARTLARSPPRRSRPAPRRVP